MVLNLSMVALFALAALLLFSASGPSLSNLTAVFILHYVGFALMMTAGFSGGELVFKHHLGVVDAQSQAEAQPGYTHKAAH